MSVAWRWKLEDMAREVVAHGTPWLWKKNGAKAAIRKATDTGSADPFELRVLPDAWAELPHRDGGIRGIVFLEIEDTSTMTREKVDEYLDLWWQMDCEGLAFYVQVCDRYGTQLRNIPLMDLFYTRMGYGVTAL